MMLFSESKSYGFAQIIKSERLTGRILRWPLFYYFCFAEACPAFSVLPEKGNMQCSEGPAGAPLCFLFFPKKETCSAAKTPPKRPCVSCSSRKRQIVQNVPVWNDRPMACPSSGDIFLPALSFSRKYSGNTEVFSAGGAAQCYAVASVLKYRGASSGVRQEGHNVRCNRWIFGTQNTISDRNNIDLILYTYYS